MKLQYMNMIPIRKINLSKGLFIITDIGTYKWDIK